MSKQTAVNYLIKEFSEILGTIPISTMQTLLLTEAIQKAKLLEEKQLIQFASEVLRSTNETPDQILNRLFSSLPNK